MANGPPPPVGQIINNVQAPNQLVNLQQMGASATILNQIPYNEIPTYGESFDQKGFDARRMLMVDWNDAHRFPADMLGDVAKDQANPGYLTRQEPEIHPNRTTLWADECRLVEGRGAYVASRIDGLISYVDFVNQTDGKAIFEVTYRNRPYQVLSDTANRNADAAQAAGFPGGAAVNSQYEFGRWVQREIFYNLETFSVNGNAFKWNDQAVKPNLIPEGIAIRRPLEERKYTWFWVPQSTVDQLEANVMPNVVGRINSIGFDNCIIGTMFCSNPAYSEPRYTPSGNQCRDITYTFLRRLDYPWDYFYRKGQGFQQVVAAQAGLPGPYLTANFNQLFKVP